MSITSSHLIILAAGVSSRMKRSATAVGLGEDTSDADALNRPKSLIRVGDSDRPFLDYVLANAKAAGYSDIVLVVSEPDTLIRSYYGPKDRGNAFHGLQISYAIQPLPEGREKPLGTADAVLCGALSKPEWSGSHFTVCNSDNIYSVEAFSTLLHSPYSNALIAYDTRGLRFAKEQEYNNAILEKDAEGYLTAIVEKPGAEVFEQHRSQYGVVEVSMNIFRFDYDMILPFLRATPLHPVRQEKETPGALTLLLSQHPRSVFCHGRNEFVPDLTSSKDIPLMRKYVARHFATHPF